MRHRVNILPFSNKRYIVNSVHDILNCGGTYKHYTLQPINKQGPLEERSSLKQPLN